MADYTVQLIFNDGTNTYQFPYIQSIQDPVEGMKATVIPGARADGSLVIDGGKRSQKIVVNGMLWVTTGYADLTTLISTMRTKVTTKTATLTLQHRPVTGGSWVEDWVFTVRRIDEITFDSSDRTATQKYSVSFLVLQY